MLREKKDHKRKGQKKTTTRRTKREKRTHQSLTEGKKACLRARFCAFVSLRVFLRQKESIKSVMFEINWKKQLQEFGFRVF
jgi:hypothetical protein